MRNFILNKFKTHWWFLCLLFINVVAFAAVISPVSLLNQVANQMIAELQSNKSQLKTSQGSKVINDIVNRVLVPHVDVDTMSAAVVGRQYWLSASAIQKQQFIQEFKKLVISTYASALASYDDDQIQFYPLRGGYANASRIVVRSQITRKNGQKIQIVYNVMRVGDAWKVYDFSIDNISMVQSYRSQFSSVLASGGMENLLKRLYAHNQQVQ